jgi:endoglucanase
MNSIRLSTLVACPTLLTTFGILALSACSHNEPGAATGGTGSPGPSTVSTKECGGEYVIDDVADANNQIIVQDGRKGYWYTFVDKVGTTISPPAGHKFIQSPGGANGLQYSAHMLGKVSSSGDPQYAGMGFSFMNPKGAYDASKYTGVSFFAKVGTGSQTNVRLKIPDVNTDPDGKVCTECFNDFGLDLELTDQWKKFTIPFAQMSQMDGWGSPQKDHIDKTKLYGMQWQVNKAGASYDIWVSDVQFTGCP